MMLDGYPPILEIQELPWLLERISGEGKRTHEVVSLGLRNFRVWCVRKKGLYFKYSNLPPWFFTGVGHEKTQLNEVRSTRFGPGSDWTCRVSYVSESPAWIFRS